MTKNEILKKSIQTIKNNHAIKILESQNYKQSCYDDKIVLDLANKLGDLKIKIAKAENENSSSFDLVIEKKELLKQFLLRLKAVGKDTSKIFPTFDCKNCNDTGFLTNGEMCECLKNLYHKNLMIETGLDLEKIPSLNQLDLKKYGCCENEIKNVVSHLLALTNSQFNTVLFSGSTGTGKTYISKSFAKTLCENEILTRFYSASEINKIFCKAHFNINNIDEILSDLFSCEVLIIDDLGTEAKYKNITVEYFINLLSERQNKNKITLITTNLTLNDLKNIYTERFLSRILDKEISLKFAFQGKDLRV